MVKSVYAVDIGVAFNLGNRGIGQVFPDLSSLVNVLLNNVYILAGVLLFFLAIAGGWAIIMGAGSGDSGQVGKGQKALTAAIIGFVIVFASWWIIRIIEIVTSQPILNNTGL